MYYKTFLFCPVCEKLENEQYVMKNDGICPDCDSVDLVKLFNNNKTYRKTEYYTDKDKMYMWKITFIDSSKFFTKPFKIEQDKDGSAIWRDANGKPIKWVDNYKEYIRQKSEERSTLEPKSQIYIKCIVNGKDISEDIIKILSKELCNESPKKIKIDDNKPDSIKDETLEKIKNKDFTKCADIYTNITKELRIKGGKEGNVGKYEKLLKNLKKVNPDLLKKYLEKNDYKITKIAQFNSLLKDSEGWPKGKRIVFTKENAFFHYEIKDFKFDEENFILQLKLNDDAIIKLNLLKDDIGINKDTMDILVNVTSKSKEIDKKMDEASLKYFSETFK